MINWQEWVVGVLVVLCIARIIYGIFLFFRRTRENKNPCVPGSIPGGTTF